MAKGKPLSPRSGPGWRSPGATQPLRAGVIGTVTLFSDLRGGKPTQTEFAGKSKGADSYHHFVDCCLDPDLPRIASGEEILQVARRLEAIYTSQRTGKAVVL